MIFQIRDFEKRAIENGEIVQIEKNIICNFLHCKKSICLLMFFQFSFKN